MSANYSAVGGQPSPYASGQPHYEESSGFITPHPTTKRTSNWVKIGVPVLILVIIGAIIGGVLGSRAANKSSDDGSSTGSSTSGSSGQAAGSQAASIKLEVGRFATATNSEYMIPVYPSTTNTAAFTSPTFVNNNALAWPKDTFQPSSPNVLKTRTDRPTLIAPAYKWHALPALIQADPYLKGWNDTIFGNATTYYALPPVKYNYDGSSGILDNSREIKMRIKAFAYTYRMTNDTKWQGVTQLTTSVGWWSNDGIEGNWNCVCNSGLTLGSLAILDDDTTGVAKQLLGLTVPNALKNCAQAVSDDGTWAETANYWYFGTTAHAEMSSALLTATGSDYGLLDTNSNFDKTGKFHMYVAGATSLFNYGDHGPNKFSTTANSMLYYGDKYAQPQYVLFQREQYDAAEPWSMFWYNPTISGAFWDGLALDQFFDNELDQWASMRSSWTDPEALYVAVKAGKNQNHQTHNDLDVGDFVLDALGTRWAGELGSGDYNSPGYFNSDAQDAERWKYYRKMTEGQNTLLINQANQNVAAAPTVQHDTSGTKQGSSTVLDIPSDSTAWWSADITSAYFDA
ncbi:hypothetical protein C0991_000474 [Blastosporella zonata]|nr:hypothetical protein C0991_000474 [Blastosporella zonata]